MSIYLAESLANHRRGRFLSSLIQAQPLGDGLDVHGCVLMVGKDYQQMPSKGKLHWHQWCRLSGNVLLLLPPYKSGVIDDKLDWNIGFTEDSSSIDDSLTSLLSSEVTQHLTGKQGLSDRGLGHLWGDAFNTRYTRDHAASGIFAATCLPLWSISLLDKSDIVHSWLDFFITLAGEAEVIDEAGQVAEIILQPIDYSVLICLYAWKVKNADELLAFQSKLSVAIFNLSQQEIKDSLVRLRQIEFIDNDGLSELGLTSLLESAYWPYAETLKEQTV